MTRLPKSPVRRILLGLAAACIALTASCLPLSPQSEVVREDDDCPACKDCKSRVCQNPTMMALAHDLDDLEEHIDK